VRRFLEADTARQLAQLIAPDDEPASLSVDVAQAGPGGDDAVEAARLYRRVDVNSFTSW
jgi:hypothetical protein